MMTENSTLTRQQTNVEQQALFPTAQEPELTTDDVVIRGVDSIETPDTLENKPDFDTLFESIKAEYKVEFEDALDSKVERELVAQIFRSYKNKDVPNGYVNLNEMRIVIAQEISSSLERHLIQAQVIDNDWIPSARLRPHWTPKYDKPTDFLVKDIPMLEAREEAHLSMVEYLNVLQPIDKEEGFALTDAYVSRFIEEARHEVVAILVQQQEELKAEVERKKKALERNKQDLEESRLRADDKISELQQTIAHLTSELSASHIELGDRDIEMLDNEMAAYIANEAKVAA